MHMANIFADGIEVNVEDGQWRLYNTDGAYSLSPFFTAIKGTGLINYVAKFAEARGLPGTVLAADYVKAVVVGFDERRQCWAIGLHVTLHKDEKPRFVELAHWPAGGNNPDYALSSHESGRILAEFIGVPLKLFGAEKVQGLHAEGRSTARITGTLSPVRRTELDIQKVRLRADAAQLPLTFKGITISGAKNSIVIRYAKESEQEGFNQCLFDKESQLVKLLPPTGFLGALRGPQGRAIQYADIRNVELQHNIIHKSSIVKGDDGMAVDMSTKVHEYVVSLMLSGEAIKLLRLIHTVAGELAHLRSEMAFAGKDGYDADRQMAYLRQHQLDQKHHDQIVEFTEEAAFVIAGALTRPLVRLESSDE